MTAHGAPSGARASSAPGDAAVGSAAPDPAPGVVETHVSVLFFYGDRVVKVRRPVTYGFANFSELERRRIDCEREIALNRRLAPDVYLGTMEMSMEGRPVEHAVVMRRLPADRNLASLVESGADVSREIGRIASVLAAFHAGGARSDRIDAAGTADALWQRWQSTEEELGRFVGPVVDPVRYRTLTARARRYVEGRAPLLRQRIAAGAICDGHGDLQAADIFCLDDGPRLLDCLEFDDELRYGDVLADVAFLSEDLERLGDREAAVMLLHEYQRWSDREEPAALWHFYVAARAHVRLLVDCLRLEQGLPVAASEPDRLLGTALAHLRAAQPHLVLVGGLPGSGKSTLAQSLGEELGAVVLSTDHVRGEVLAQAPGTRSTEERYREASRHAVYEHLCERAGALLGTGRSVVLDATWTEQAMRRLAAAVARAASADLVELHCECPPPCRDERIIGRLGLGTTESAATPEIAAAMAAVDEPWPSAVPVDTSGPAARSLQLAMSALERDPGP